MNRKQFIILLALVGVVGAAGLLVRQHGSDSWHSAGGNIGGKLLPGLAVNDIAQIRIQSGTNELNLTRRDNLWRVRERADYAADFSQIRDLIMKLADLKISQTEEIGPSQLGRFGLLPPGPATNSGTQFDLKDPAGKTLAALLLGKTHLKKPAADSQFGGLGGEGWPDGRYVMTGAGSGTVAVISDPLQSVQPKPELWLDKDFLKIEKPRAVAVQFSEPTNSWKLIRASETNEWVLADARPNEKLDASKIYGVTSPFSSVSFNDVAPLSSNNLPDPATVTVETFDGFTYVARIGSKANEYYPVSFVVTARPATERTPANGEKPEDKTRLDKAFKDRQSQLSDQLTRDKQFEHWVYQLPAYSVEEILKPRPQILSEMNTNTPPQAHSS
jgi:hypothetical protein